MRRRVTAPNAGIDLLVWIETLVVVHERAPHDSCNEPADHAADIGSSVNDLRLDGTGRQDAPPEPVQYIIKRRRPLGPLVIPQSGPRDSGLGQLPAYSVDRRGVR